MRRGIFERGEGLKENFLFSVRFVRSLLGDVEFLS